MSLGVNTNVDALSAQIKLNRAGSLDYDKGGELTLNLGRLYDFMLRHLAEGLMAKSASLLQEIRAGFEQGSQAAGHEPA